MYGPIDNTREYATVAIIRYMKLGCPTRKEYEDKLRREVYDRLAGKNPEHIFKAAEIEVRKHRALLEDIDAVNKMFDMLLGNISMSDVDIDTAVKNGTDIANAVNYVYFGLSRVHPSHRRIAGRVREYAMSLPTTERTVYRWLKYARKLFAVNRGLTIE